MGSARWSFAGSRDRRRAPWGPSYHSRPPLPRPHNAGTAHTGGCLARSPCPVAFQSARRHAIRHSAQTEPHGSTGATWNWLRVFPRVNAAHLPPGGGQARSTTGVQSEKCVRRSGNAYEAMGMITARCARVLPRCTGHLWMDFLVILHEVGPVSKTCNQLMHSQSVASLEATDGRGHRHVTGCAALFGGPARQKHRVTTSHAKAEPGKFKA
jgi:hypothetical protein